MKLLSGFVILAVVVVGGAASAEDPPALPAGLGEDVPSLPSGLDSDAPNLPAGLRESPESDTSGPALPPGLGSAPETGNASEGPALPSGLTEEAAPQHEDDAPETALVDRLPSWLHGFAEVRGGLRTQEDRVQPRRATIGETRLQLKTRRFWQGIGLHTTADVYFDGATEEGKFDLRQAYLTWSPLNRVDVRAGRQVLTWGTGDLLFINDLFPKDWQSFFTGRDVEYLKAPSDAIKIGWYPSWLNVELAYTPQFDPDRYITGERISYYHPLFGPSGRDRQVDTNPPSTWFEDDEFALRLYRMLGRYEVAAYGYSGYWKSPAGQRLIPFQATFPKLNVYGASVRGPVGKGLFNIEAGYYDSRQDPGGGKVYINNGEFRFLVGYERELGKEFTGGFSITSNTCWTTATTRTRPFRSWLNGTKIAT